MSSYNLKHNDLAAVIGNMIKLVFFDNTRINAKRVYQDGVQGKLMRLPAISMPDKSQLKVHLKINASEFVGTLSFSYFRKHLGLLLSRIAETLAQGEIEVLSAEDGRQHIFKVPVAYVLNDTVNIMALGFDMENDVLTIKLMYLESNQFKSDESQDDVA